MSKDIRTKNHKKEKMTDKIKKPSAYQSESKNNLTTTTSKPDNSGSGKSKS